MLALLLVLTATARVLLVQAGKGVHCQKHPGPNDRTLQHVPLVAPRHLFPLRREARPLSSVCLSFTSATACGSTLDFGQCQTVDGPFWVQRVPRQLPLSSIHLHSRKGELQSLDETCSMAPHRRGGVRGRGLEVPSVMPTVQSLHRIPRRFVVCCRPAEIAPCFLEVSIYLTQPRCFVFTCACPGFYDPTCTLVIRVETVEAVTGNLRVVGYALLNIFVQRADVSKQPTDSASKVRWPSLLFSEPRLVSGVVHEPLTTLSVLFYPGYLAERGLLSASIAPTTAPTKR